MLIRKDVHDVKRIVRLPKSNSHKNAVQSEDERNVSKNEEDGVDQDVWIFEQLRFAMKYTLSIIRLFLHADESVMISAILL